MANRFWVGGAGTWDASDTTHWAQSSGTAGGFSVPGPGDTVTFNASSGGGTVTVSTTVSITSLATSGFAGTIDFTGSTDPVTLTSDCFFDGTATRTINMGSRTWTMGGTGANTFQLNQSGLTLIASSANLIFNGNSANRALGFGTSNSYGSLTISNNSTKGWVSLSVGTGVTFGSVTVGSGNTVGFPQGITTTITGALTVTGTSSAQSGIMSNGPTTNAATISVGAASTITWGSILRVTRAGAGTLDATNSFDLGGNTSFTSITAPSGGGGGGGQRVISG